MKHWSQNNGARKWKAQAQKCKWSWISLVMNETKKCLKRDSSILEKDCWKQQANKHTSFRRSTLQSYGCHFQGNNTNKDTIIQLINTPPQQHSHRWNAPLNCSKLPLGVTECVNVCAWWPAMDWHPFNGIQSLSTWGFLWIHYKPCQNKALYLSLFNCQWWVVAVLVWAVLWVVLPVNGGRSLGEGGSKLMHDA